jgi:RimJ/RimL family protein N-acetyltransferase
LSTARAPEIETQRLILRPHRVDDFDASFAMWRDPIVTRYIGGTPSGEQQAWSRLLNYAGHWALLGFGYWAVEEKVSREFIGELGFADFRRDIDPLMRNAPELGWAFASRVHGRGYATEAVGAVLTWSEARFESSRTVCLIHPENLASIRVAQKCGYREFKRQLFNDRPVVLFERVSRETDLNRKL